MTDLDQLSSDLRVAVMRLRRRLANERDPLNDLSTRTMEVLGALYREGPATVGDLAAFERVQPPSMTRTVDHLQERGYVTRSQSSDDKRRIMVEITQAGIAILKEGRDRRNAWLVERLAQLSDDDAEVLRRAAPLLEKLTVLEPATIESRQPPTP